MLAIAKNKIRPGGHPPAVIPDLIQNPRGQDHVNSGVKSLSKWARGTNDFRLQPAVFIIPRGLGKATMIPQKTIRSTGQLLFVPLSFLSKAKNLTTVTRQLPYPLPLQ